MTEQLYKRFTDEQMKALLVKYVNREIKVNYILEILGIKRRQFFKLLKKYTQDPQGFSVHPARENTHRKIRADVEEHIIEELSIEKKLVEDKTTPMRFYNYSYIKDQILKQYGQKVSVPTVIDRAKAHGFYFSKPEKKLHDHEVITNYVGVGGQVLFLAHFSPYPSGLCIV